MSRQSYARNEFILSHLHTLELADPTFHANEPIRTKKPNSASHTISPRLKLSAGNCNKGLSELFLALQKLNEEEENLDEYIPEDNLTEAQKQIMLSLATKFKNRAILNRLGWYKKGGTTIKGRLKNLISTRVQAGLEFKQLVTR